MDDIKAPRILTNLQVGSMGNVVPPQPKKLLLSWQTVFDGIDALAHMVTSDAPNLIVGVSRGGLIPAVLLSHKLGIPLEVISISAYEGTRRTLEKPVEVRGWEDRYDSTKTLVVDDILDTGASLEAIRYKTGSYNHNFHFVSLVNKRPELNSRNVFFMQTPRDVWVQFPWEQNEA